jgi:hypothetical protein
MAVKYIIIEDYHGDSRTADSEAECEDQLVELMNELTYELGVDCSCAINSEEVEDYIRVFEIKQELKFEHSFKLKPKKKETKTNGRSS